MFLCSQWWYYSWVLLRAASFPPAQLPTMSLSLLVWFLRKGASQILSLPEIHILVSKGQLYLEIYFKNLLVSCVKSYIFDSQFKRRWRGDHQISRNWDYTSHQRTCFRVIIKLQTLLFMLLKLCNYGFFIGLSLLSQEGNSSISSDAQFLSIFKVVFDILVIANDGVSAAA